MSQDGAIVGVAAPCGWAILVTVGADGTLIDRRRVELLDAGLPRLPHHHQAQSLPLDAGLALVERVRTAADRCARTRAGLRAHASRFLAAHRRYGDWTHEYVAIVDWASVTSPSLEGLP